MANPSEMPGATPVAPLALAGYQDGAVVSRTLLKRGGGTVTSVEGARAAGALVLRFADGAVDARVERSGGAPYVKDKPEQPDLF